MKNLFDKIYMQRWTIPIFVYNVRYAHLEEYISNIQTLTFRNEGGWTKPRRRRRKDKNGSYVTVVNNSEIFAAYIIHKTVLSLNKSRRELNRYIKLI